MSRLEVIAPASLQGETRDLWGGAVLVGRSHDADWHIADPTVSRRHALVRHFADHDEIEDLGSLSGTCVNGRRIDGPVVLRPGDVVELAGARLRYVADDVEVVAPTAAAGPAHDGLLASLSDEDTAGGPEWSSVGVVARALVGLGGVLVGAGAVVFLVALVVGMAGSGQADAGGVEIGGVPAAPAALGLAVVGFALVVAGLVAQKLTTESPARR